MAVQLLQERVGNDYVVIDTVVDNTAADSWIKCCLRNSIKKATRRNSRD